jgi:hypothetical protein
VYLLADQSEAPSRNLLVCGAALRFNPNVALQVTYTVGREEPEFKKTETIKVGVSIKF